MVDNVNIKRLQHSISLVNEKSIINKSGVKKGKINCIISTITKDMNIQVSHMQIHLQTMKIRSNGYERMSFVDSISYMKSYGDILWPG